MIKLNIIVIYNILLIYQKIILITLCIHIFELFKNLIFQLYIFFYYIVLNFINKIIIYIVIN
jgi:hypothetical protein